MSTTDNAVDAGIVDEEISSAGAETSMGLDENVAGAAAYVLGIISGLVVFLVETENRQVKWHGAQSMVLFLGVGVTYFVLSTLFVATTGFGGVFGFGFAFLGLLFPLLFLGILALWVFMMVRTYQGHTVRIPIAAGIADSIAN